MTGKWTRLRVAVGVFALFILNGALMTVYQHLRSRLYGNKLAFGTTIINEMGSAVAGASLLGFCLYMFLRRPFQFASWRGWVLIHAGAILLYSSLHTSAYLGIRAVSYPWFGYGPYNPGSMRIRHAMELPNDVITYMKWFLLLLAFQYYSRIRDREALASALEHNLAEAKLRNLQAQIQPHFLMNALNAISSLIYSNPRAADEMIAPWFVSSAIAGGRSGTAGSVVSGDRLRSSLHRNHEDALRGPFALPV